MQLVLQRRGFKLSPITALYYIAPAVVPLLLTTAFIKVEKEKKEREGVNEVSAMETFTTPKPNPT
jgi:hypothetical protein